MNEKTDIKVNAFGKNLPEKKFTAGPISVTVWHNEGKNKDGEETEFQTVTLQRTYKDKEGKWQHTSNLRTNDLPRATLLLQKAYEYIVLKREVEETQ
jgi:hypothetical protein